MGEGSSQETGDNPPLTPPRRGRQEKREHRMWSDMGVLEFFYPMSAQNANFLGTIAQFPCTFLAHAKTGVFICKDF